MRLQQGNAHKYLTLLRDYVARDTGSIAGWSLTILKGILPGESAELRLQVLEAHLANIEGVMVRGANGDLLLLFRGIDGAGQGRLVKIITEALDLESEPYATGFDLTLQREPAAAALQQQLKLMDKSDTDTVEESHGQDPEGLKYMAHVLDNSKFSRQYRSPMTVLLVEDDPVTCRLAGNLLRKDYVLITAASAYEAVVNYLIYAPDIVFLDINLPDDSGLSVLEQLTACDPDAFIVMFSGNDGIDNIINARARGAMGFIAKPFQRDRLRHYLDEKEHQRESGKLQN